LLSQIINAFDVRPSVITLFDAYDTIVPFSVTLFSLLSLDNANRPALQ